MPSTSGMKSGGFYDRHSSGQRSSIEALLPWVDRAAAEVQLPSDSSAITLVDYGCSEGRNSMFVLGRAADALRARGADHPMVGVFSDLASNNFNQVFANLSFADQLAAQKTNWYPLIAGGSFYGPLLPPATVHLGLSFNSVCWLDVLPAVPLPEFIIYPGPRPHRPDVHVSPAAVAAFSAQAASDLRRFLECRAAEMASGARLMLAVPGRNTQHWTGGGIYDVLHDACIDLIRAGKIDRAAYERTVMPVYFRTLEEMLAPLEGSDAPLAAVFTVEKAKCMESPTSFVVDYQRSGDLARYVEEYIGFVQAFSEPVIRAGLESTSSPEAISAIYERAKERLAAAPRNYPFHYLQVALLLARR